MNRLIALCFLLLPLGLAACASSGSGVSERAVVAPGKLKVVDYDGRTHDLGAYLQKGEPVVLVFWQTWCESCLEEAPKLGRLAAQYEKLHFVGVVPGDEDTVDEGEVRSVAKSRGMTYPQVLDRNLSLTNAFGVSGTPTIVVLGQGGEILHQAHDTDLPWAELAR